MTKHRILLGTHGHHIHTVVFDDQASTLTHTKKLDFVEDPSWLHRHPTQKNIIYSNGHVDGKVFALRVDSEGKLEILDEANTLGGGPTHMGVLKDGSGLAIAHYKTGDIALIPLSAEGRFTSTSPSPKQTFKFPYTHLNHPRQEAGHAHQIVVLEDEILVPDLGGNVVWRMGYDGQKGWEILGKVDGLEEGDGPRHCVVHPSGKYIYILNEVSSILSVHTLPPSGPSKLIKKLPIYPPQDKENLDIMTAAEIILLPSTSSSGPVLICTNRDSRRKEGDALALYTVSEDDGSSVEPTKEGWYWGVGKHVRALEVSPDGKWIVTAGRNTGGVVILERVGEGLKEVARCEGIERVVCPIWL